MLIVSKKALQQRPRAVYIDGLKQIALSTTDQQTEGACPSLLQSHHTVS